MSQSKTKHKTSWYQILFRICILLLSIFLGIEGGLYIWEQWQYSNAVKKIQLPEDLGSTKQQTYILALGDSITQLGYAKILENTKGGEYTLHNAAAAGSSIDVVKKTLENNINILTNRRHEIIVMTGHNSCLGLTQFAKDQINVEKSNVDFQTQEIFRSIRTIRFLHMLYTYATQDKRTENTEGSLVLERYLNCSRVLDEDFKEIIEIAIQNNLSMHLMTYPFPKNTLEQKKWNHFMWMSMLINKYIREMTQNYNIPLIDAELCMENVEVKHWQNDLFHLNRSGSLKHIDCIFEHLGMDP